MARGGRPLVRLVPVEVPERLDRRLGIAKGQIVLHEGWEDDIPLEWFEVLTGEDDLHA